MSSDTGFALIAVLLLVAFFPDEVGETLGKVLTAIENRGQTPTAPATSICQMERPTSD